VLLAEQLPAGSWLNWLADRLTAAGREVRLCPAGAELDPGAWRDELIRTMVGLPDDDFDLVAHSAGCLLWLHHAALTDAAEPPAELPRPARVALIAPPAASAAPPGLEAFYPVPLQIDAVRRGAEGTVLVGSDGDPRCPAGVAAEYGTPLKMATTVVPGAGGFTAADGYAEWPAVLDWCGRANLAFIA